MESGKKQILVVDDELIILNVTTAILEHAGYSVATAPSRERTLGVCQRNGHLVLIVSAVAIRGMNGRELAECFGKVQPPVPVVLMASYESPDPRFEDLNQGHARGYSILMKPFRSQDLLHAVSQALAETPVNSGSASALPAACCLAPPTH